MRRFLNSFILILLCLSGKTQFQDLIFKHINRSSGLPVDGVTCLAQDSTGYIWIGSKEGLFRFDGFNYKSFYYIPGSKLSIPNNEIAKIYVDRNNLIWVATTGGVAVLKNTGEVKQIINTETNTLFTKESERITDILQTNNTLWITTGEGLFSVSKTNDSSFKVKVHDFNKQFGINNQLGKFTVDSHGWFWISTTEGLVIYDPAKNTLVHSYKNPSSLEILKEEFPFGGIYIDEINELVHYTTWEPSEKIYDLRTNKI